MPPAMILCGGQGTRLRDLSELLPKPMVPIGGQPIVWHIMKTYAAQGVSRFILCLGYRREVFIDYFLNYHARATDITIKLGCRNQLVYHGRSGEEDWEVTLADTGEATMTGGRVARAARYLGAADDDFFLTYGDAVADLDLAALWQAHRQHGKLLTVTAVHPSGRFGEINLRDGAVVGFHEKPQTETGLINGGFMVARREFVSRHLALDEALVLEQDPMRAVVAAGQMHAYLHEGFWQCMDTPREYKLLNDLWEAGNAPWTKAWPALA